MNLEFLEDREDRYWFKSDKRSEFSVGGPLTPVEVAIGARAAVDQGASAVLVNCVPAERTLEYLEGLADLGVPFGAYANGGRTPRCVEHYTDAALTWRDLGATLIGSCCCTGPAHIRALRAVLG